MANYRCQVTWKEGLESTFHAWLLTASIHITASYRLKTARGPTCRERQQTRHNQELQKYFLLSKMGTSREILTPTPTMTQRGLRREQIYRPGWLHNGQQQGDWNETQEVQGAKWERLDQDWNPWRHRTIRSRENQDFKKHTQGIAMGLTVHGNGNQQGRSAYYLS